MANEFKIKHGLDLADNDILNIGNAYLGEYLYHDGDLDTYLRFGDNATYVYTQGIEMVRYSGGNLIDFNYSQQAMDVRFRTDNVQDAIFIDGNADTVSFGVPIELGNIEIAEDSGAVTLVNMPVSATPTIGTEESYSFQIDDTDILKVYAEADSAGGIQNPRAEVTGALTINGDVAYAQANANDLVIGDGTALAGITIATSDSVYGSIHFSDANTGIAQYAGLIRYYHQTNVFEFFTASTLAMTLNGLNFLGVGIAPLQPLHVADEQASNTVKFQLENQGGNDGSLRIGQFPDAAGFHITSNGLPGHTNTVQDTISEDYTGRTSFEILNQNAVALADSYAKFRFGANSNGNLTSKFMFSGDGTMGINRDSSSSYGLAITDDNVLGGIHISGSNAPGITMSDTTDAGYAYVLTQNGGSVLIAADEGNVAANTIFQVKVDGSEVIEVDSTLAVQFNNAYSFPTSTGTVGQVLTLQSGASALDWEDGGSDVITSYTEAFVDGDLDSGGLLVITHSLNSNYPNISIYDNEGNLVAPDEVTNTDSNTTTIDVSSFIPLTGTWNVRISVGSGGTPSGGSPVGNTGAIQFTDGADFDGDASEFYWDNVNKRLGLHDASPSYKIDIISLDGNDGINNVYGNARTFTGFVSGEGATSLYDSSGVEQIRLRAYSGHDSYINGNLGVDVASPSSTLDVGGDVEIDSTGAFYMGDPTTDGTWRITRSGSNLVIQVRESSSWVTKQTVMP